MNHRNNFNLLRLIAAQFVIISHSYELTGHINDEPLLVISNGSLSLSAIGLYIFFFISGHLVAKSAAYSSSWHSFLLKRILRIYPALIVVVLISTFVIGPLFSTLSVESYLESLQTWRYLITIIGFKIKYLLPGLFERSSIKSVNASLWTISLELKLYLILCILLILNLLHNKKFYSFIFPLLIIICLATFYLDPSRTTVFLSPHLMKLITIFFIGSFFSLYQMNSKLLGLLILTGVTLVVLKVSHRISTQTPLGELLLFSSLTYYIAYKIPHFKLRDDISYGIYLAAFPVQQVIFLFSGYNQSAPANAIFSLLVCIVYGFISWRFIEQPCLQLKHKLK